MLNILISCVGRRDDLVTSFKKELGNDGVVVVTDINKDATGVKVADLFYEVPSFKSEKYIDKLLEICLKESVKFIISLNVEDLMILVKNRVLFENIGCNVIGGEEFSILRTYDKYLLAVMCKEANLGYLPTSKLEDYIFNDNDFKPVILKPRFGCGSRGIEIISNYEKYLELKESLLFELQNYIVQPFVEGQEFGLDIINDLDGNFVTVYVRKKVEMKNGETFKAITISNREWLGFGEKLSEILGHQGTIDVDVILKDSIIYIIDINYRFGGGYAFNKAAGANTPGAYVEWMKGAPTDYRLLSYEADQLAIRELNGNVEIV